MPRDSLIKVLLGATLYFFQAEKKDKTVCICWGSHHDVCQHTPGELPIMKTCNFDKPLNN